ncbi:MAG: phosphorylase [Bacteroidetes bacterium]|nr:MAG: phosphorylase [Bacteroidota bacterium]
MSKQMSESELILNPDGSVYHLHLLPSDIAETIFLVGDPERVHEVSIHFDTIEVKKAHREFVTHTGTYQGSRFSVLSTGIGTDNIDIVLNELNLLFNADLSARKFYPKRKSIRLVRLGTSGTVNPEWKPGKVVLSKEAIGLDGLAWYYGFDSRSIAAHFSKMTNWSVLLAKPYVIEASSLLLNLFSSRFETSTTLTCTGFYHPQGRSLESDSSLPITSETLLKAGIGNLEMETSGIYLLAQYFGFEALSVNALLANRSTGEFHPNPASVVKEMIQSALDIMATSDKAS